MHNKFTEEESDIINRCNTPEKVQEFLRSLAYNFDGDKATLMSFRRVVRSRKAHCLEGAMAAASILGQHGYEPLILCMEASDIDHNIFVFRNRGRWGSIAQSRDQNLLGRDPVHRTVWDLVYSYYPFCYNYFTGDKEDLTLRGYSQPISLNRFKQNWVISEQDLWFVENHLYQIPYRFLFPRNKRNLYTSGKDEIIRLVE